MSRDFKHRARRRKKPAHAPAWLWTSAGLAVGLAVAAAVYVYDRRPGGVVAARNGQLPAASASEVADSAAVAGDAVPEKSRFSFYELLPKFEVVIPEAEQDVAPDDKPDELTRPGSYVLQAGSFRSFEDADGMKATLALQGIESRIQRVAIDSDTWHRVRIGPIEELDELNRIRSRLRDARIEILLIRLGE